MSRPAWMPSKDQVLQQLVIAAILAGIVYAYRRARAGQPIT